MTSWKPISTAPRDGSLFLIKEVVDGFEKLPNFYSAWYEKPSKQETMNGVEYDGHIWVLNDDEKSIEVDENDSNLYWMEIPE